ncbi:Nif3-like dinuclear metal center hexameric protein [Pseudomonas sp. F1_0610]|uniref:Nif3-like dinuclear metal center hexameric protein n=1 Tax=Pseudomonas sp. F1_0610 TaxID=3114284 RepID=UPI0039C2C833
MSISRNELLQACDTFLSTQAIADYCPNGLQVEGSEHIQCIVSGVSASQALIERAIELKADALLVHHGYFWKGEDQRIIGMKQRRIKALLAHDINLIGYHLPLDIHPEVGNNVQLAQRLGINITGGLDPNNPYSIGLLGELTQSVTATELAERINLALQRPPLTIDVQRPIKTVAWCTGGAQDYIAKAAALNADAYITGEVSERTVLFARENNINFFAAGHHATERYGVQALGEWLAKRFNLTHHFIDCDNPA